MKKLVLGSILFLFTGIGHSQIMLDEARVNYQSEAMVVDDFSQSYTLNITESYYKEFEKAPLDFVRNKFDVEKFIRDNKKEKFSSIEVVFKTRKGQLLASYSGKGKLVSTHMKLKDVALPDQIRLLILEQHRNANIIGSKHVVTTKGWDIKKDNYTVKILDQGKSRNIKIHKGAQGYAVAGL